MTDYQWPADLVPQEQTFALEHNGLRNESPFNRKVQDIVRSGARWRASVVFHATGTDKTRQARALAAQMGFDGRVWMGDHSVLSPLGAFAGEDCRVNGAASAGATSVAVDGLTVSTLNIFKAGEPIELKNPIAGTSQLVTCVEDMDSDSGGAGTLYFKPALRIALEDNAYVIVTQVGTELLAEDGTELLTEDGVELTTGSIAQAKFMLADPTVGFGARPGSISSYSMDLIEDVN